MSLFKRKEKLRTASPYPTEKYESVLRCSICTGEQVLCVRERGSNKLLELMLIKSPAQLEGFCAANGISQDDIEKVY